MKVRRIHGRLLMLTGLAHAAFAVSADAFGAQFAQFYQSLFFRAHPGLSNFPMPGGAVILESCKDFEALAAIFFFYAGPLWIAHGHLMDQMEKQGSLIPISHAIVFLVSILIGVYMVPGSGMTFFLLPQALYLLIRSARLRTLKGQAA